MLINWKNNRRETAQFEHCRVFLLVYEFLREEQFGSIFSKQHLHVPACWWAYRSEVFPAQHCNMRKQHASQPHTFAPWEIQALRLPHISNQALAQQLRPARARRVPTPSSSPTGEILPPGTPITKPKWLQLQKGHSSHARGEPGSHIFLLRYVWFPGGTVQIYIRDQVLVLLSSLDDCICHSPRDY